MINPTSFSIKFTRQIFIKLTRKVNMRKCKKVHFYNILITRCNFIIISHRQVKSIKALKKKIHKNGAEHDDDDDRVPGLQFSLMQERFYVPD